MPNPITTSGVAENPAPMRTSEILRGILVNNPGVKRFTVRRILKSIGTERFDASLMVFSIPAIVPTSGPNELAPLSTGAIALQLASGHERVQLPRFILKKAISRRSLAVAIHAVLPLIQAAERHLRPRWAWMDHALSRRALGLFVLLLALAVGFPLLGFTSFHAASIFAIALGMAEKDGLAVLIGVVAGLLCLAINLSSGVSARVLRTRTLQWLRKLTKKLGISVCADFLASRGYGQLARLLQFQWSDLLLIWDPERDSPNLVRVRARKPRAPRLRSDNKAIQITGVLDVDQCGGGIGQQPHLQAIPAAK